MQSQNLADLYVHSLVSSRGMSHKSADLLFPALRLESWSDALATVPDT